MRYSLSHNHARAITRFVRTMPLMILLVSSIAAAQEDSGFSGRVGSVFDSVTRGINAVGEKAGALFGREAQTTACIRTRTVEAAYPVPQSAMVSITNEFGEVRVDVWDSNVVQIAAEIIVQADSPETADAVSGGIEIAVAHTEDAVEAKTVLPAPSQTGKPSITVNYEVKIPRTANLTCKNDFGDTFIAGVGGTVAVDAYYGSLNLKDVQGTAHVRHRGGGEFELVADGLRQGGTFDLTGVQARFAETSGDTIVNSTGGALEFYGSPAQGNVEIATKSGPISYHLEPELAVDLTAAVIGGKIHSDIELVRTEQANNVVGRLASADADSRVNLNAVLGDIVIRSKTDQLTEAPLALEAPSYKDSLVQKHEWVAEDTPVTIQAIAGDIRIEGGDRNDAVITATKFARVAQKENIRAALDALKVEVEHVENTLTIRTVADADMAALGCTAYRIDLLIECPRTIFLNISATDGNTSLRATGGSATIVQAAGNVFLEHVKGTLNVTNQQGGISVISCAGPVAATALDGDVTMADVYSEMTVSNAKGKTVVESPHAKVTVRNTDGDVRVISLEGLEGDLDVAVEKGTIGIILPETVDAMFSAVAHMGSVQSSIQMTGNVRKDVQEFSKVGTGPYRVTLQTKNGDIHIN